MFSITSDAANAIAVAPTTRSRSARVGVGPVVAAAALTGTCRDSSAVAVFRGDLISYSLRCGRMTGDSTIADFDDGRIGSRVVFVRPMERSVSRAFG